jgi:hypothetical protein
VARPWWCCRDFQLPLPARCREVGKRKWAARFSEVSSCAETIALVGFAEAAGCSERGEVFVEGSGADAADRTQFAERQRVVGIDERGDDAIIDRALHGRLRCARIDDLERQSIDALRELDHDGGHGGRGAVLDG